MAQDNADLLAMMADVLRAIDRQTEENKRSIDGLRGDIRTIEEKFLSAMARFTMTVTTSYESLSDQIHNESS